MPVSPKILAFAGSLRKDSVNKKVLNVAVEAARSAGAEVTVADLFDLDLPIYNADIQNEQGFPENAIKFQEMLHGSDGILLCSPEYNGSIPGGLKNAIDWASRARGELKINEVFKNKLVAIMTASPGAFGGLRCLIHLRALFSQLQTEVIISEIAVPSAPQKFDGGQMTDEAYKGRIENLAKLLVEKTAKVRNQEGELR
jgi:NAD(P)H-dependent FMN reductase